MLLCAEERTFGRCQRACRRTTAAPLETAAPRSARPRCAGATRSCEPEVDVRGVGAARARCDAPRSCSFREVQLWQRSVSRLPVSLGAPARPGQRQRPTQARTRAAASTPAGARHVAAPQHVQQVRQPPSRPLRRRARRRRRAGQRSGEEAAAAVAPRWKAPPPSPKPDVRRARRSLLLTSVRARQRVGSAQQSGRGRRTATPRGARGVEDSPAIRAPYLRCPQCHKELAPLVARSALRRVVPDCQPPSPRGLHAPAPQRARPAMAESEATTQFRELQKQYIEASSKLKQVGGIELPLRCVVCSPRARA